MPNNGTGNYANDFIDAIEDSQKPGPAVRDLPPLHPNDWADLGVPAKEDIVDISALEGDTHGDEKIRSVLKLPPRGDVKFGRFNISDDVQRLELETIENNCLKVGWVLVREEWTHTKDGETFVIVKYMVSPEQPKPTT